MTTPKRAKTKLKAEPSPSHEALASIEAIEDAGVRFDFVEADDGSGDFVDVEDRSACDFQGLDLDALDEFLLALVPGYAHGYSPSLPPDRPTPHRAPTAARIVDETAVRLSAEYIHCLQRRARLGMAIHRPEDAVRQLPGRHET